MSENRLVMEAVHEARKAGRKAALATVVRVFGSAYRREGAKMLVDEQENITGMISGGCLEADVAETAKKVIETGRPILKTYAMDEDVVWGLGLGCPGTVEIHIELVSGQQPVLSAWLDCIRKEQEGILATVLPDGKNEKVHRLFIPKEGQPVGTLGDSRLDWQASNIALRKLSESNPKSETLIIESADQREDHVFVDVYIPPLKLMIFGAGHDAIPVARYGVSLGFDTIVIDQRSFYNSEERFPGTRRIVADTTRFAETVHIDSRTYIVVMNHHLERDQETLKFVLPSASPYIGVLGPRSRRIRMLEAIEKEGSSFENSQLQRMYSPIGLDIGAATPEEIAISILGEIVAIKNGHTGGFLQNSEYIHQFAKS